MLIFSTIYLYVAWSDEIRSPADGKPGICPDRNAGDGLETSDDAEPKRSFVYQSSSDSESETDQYQVWRNVNNVFAVSLAFQLVCTWA